MKKESMNDPLFDTKLEIVQPVDFSGWDHNGVHINRSLESVNPLSDIPVEEDDGDIPFEDLDLPDNGIHIRKLQNVNEDTLNTHTYK